MFTEAQNATQNPLDEVCVNNILKILAFLLEFDAEYSEDLASNHIIRGFSHFIMEFLRFFNIFFIFFNKKSI